MLFGAYVSVTEKIKFYGGAVKKNSKKKHALSIFWLILGETRWVAIFRHFRQKRQKVLVFRSLNRFLIQIFFIGPEILCSL